MKLRVQPKAESGLVQHVTPESAGWTYVGFDLQRLGPGEGIGCRAERTGEVPALLPDRGEAPADRLGALGLSLEHGHSDGSCIAYLGLAMIAGPNFGDYSRAVLQANQVLNPDALLALRVNDVDLSPNHGYPARIIVPALPGVHNTKWVSSIDFRRD